MNGYRRFWRQLPRQLHPKNESGTQGSEKSVAANTLLGTHIRMQRGAPQLALVDSP